MVLAVRFATRMIKCYGLQKQTTGMPFYCTIFFVICEIYSFYASDMPDNNSVKLHEMALLLMAIRSIQSRVSAKNQNSVWMVK
jgi:spatacsin